MQSCRAACPSPLSPPPPALPLAGLPPARHRTRRAQSEAGQGEAAFCASALGCACPAFAPNRPARPAAGRLGVGGGGASASAPAPVSVGAAWNLRCARQCTVCGQRAAQVCLCLPVCQCQRHSWPVRARRGARGAQGHKGEKGGQDACTGSPPATGGWWVSAWREQRQRASGSSGSSGGPRIPGPGALRVPSHLLATVASCNSERRRCSLAAGSWPAAVPSAAHAEVRSARERPAAAGGRPALTPTSEDGWRLGRPSEAPKGDRETR